MSVHGITIDHTGKTVPQQGDALARLEAWRAANNDRSVIIQHPCDGSPGWSIDLWGEVGREVCHEPSAPSLSEAIHAALDAWEAT